MYKIYKKAMQGQQKIKMVLIYFSSRAQMTLGKFKLLSTPVYDFENSQL